MTNTTCETCGINPTRGGYALLCTECSRDLRARRAEQAAPIWEARAKVEAERRDLNRRAWQLAFEMGA